MTSREKYLLCTIHHWFVFQYLFIYVHRVLSIQRAFSACSAIDFLTVKIDLMPLVMISHTNYEGCSGLRTDNWKLKPRILIEEWKLFWQFNASYRSVFFFEKNFAGHMSCFAGPLIPWFLISGDVCPEFEIKGGSLTCVFSFPQYYSSESHLPTPWWPAWQSIAFPTCILAEVGCRGSHGWPPISAQTCHRTGHRDLCRFFGLILLF